MNRSYDSGRTPGFRVALLGALLAALAVFVPLAVQAQDAGPQADIPPLATDAPAPALIAQAVVPKATPAAPAAPAKRVHDPLSPPVFQAGDKCTYVKSEWGKENPPYTEEIGSSSSRGVTIQATWRDQAGQYRRNYRQLTSEGNVVSYFRGATIVSYSQPKTYFHHPLVVGKSWEVNVDRPYFVESHGRHVQIGLVHERLTATYKGVETITVRAGTFQAVHVVLVGTTNVTINQGELAQRPNGFDRFSLEEHVWFSMELGCMVRHTWVERHDLLGLSHRGSYNNKWELIGYSRVARDQ